jgi:hypothetical protein
LQRQPDGSWLIVSEMFQDANAEVTYEHKSTSGWIAQGCDAVTDAYLSANH